MGGRGRSAECLPVCLPQTVAPNGPQVPRAPRARRVAGGVLAMALGVHAAAPPAVHASSRVPGVPQQP
eukprot:2757438-Alexandrium_andersonii.AAC.1